jgi:hypothetical protein
MLVQKSVYLFCKINTMKKDVFKQLILDSVEKNYTHIENRHTPLKIYENKANCIIGVRR